MYYECAWQYVWVVGIGVVSRGIIMVGSWECEVILTGDATPVNLGSCSLVAPCDTERK